MKLYLFFSRFTFHFFRINVSKFLLLTFHACLPKHMSQRFYVSTFSPFSFHFSASQRFYVFTFLFSLFPSCQPSDQKPQVIFDTVDIVKIDSFKVIEYDTLLTYLVDTVNTLVDIDSSAWFYFTQNFHDSMVYKTYAIVYSDTIFRNKRSPFENNKTKFIKWKNVIFEMYE